MEVVGFVTWLVDANEDVVHLLELLAALEERIDDATDVYGIVELVLGLQLYVWIHDI